MNPFNLNIFMSGALMMASAVAGIFFLKFWHHTKDRFFFLFAAAFGMMACERIALLLINASHEERTYIYLIRFVAFLLIIYAILEKNRPKPKA